MRATVCGWVHDARDIRAGTTALKSIIQYHQNVKNTVYCILLVEEQGNGLVNGLRIRMRWKSCEGVVEPPSWWYLSTNNKNNADHHQPPIKNLLKEAPPFSTAHYIFIAHNRRPILLVLLFFCTLICYFTCETIERQICSYLDGYTEQTDLLHLAHSCYLSCLFEENDNGYNF